MITLKNFDYICFNQGLASNAYCKDCHIDICEKCLKNEHFSHQSVHYNDFYLPDNIEEYIEKIKRKNKKKKEIYEKFSNWIKKNNLNQKYEEKIKRIQSIYENNKNINYSLLTLLEFNHILYLYQKEKNKFNFAGIYNMIQTSNFNFPLIKLDNDFSEETIDLMYNFFKDDLILNPPVILSKNKKSYKLKKTLFSNPIKEKDENIPNQISINCLLALDNSLLISGRDDGAIYIYEPFLLSLKKKKKAHDSKILYLSELKYGENNNTRICSCSEDKIIKFWLIGYDINKPSELLFEEQFPIRDAHSLTINKIIDFDEKSIASCSNDKYIKLWQKNDKFSKIKEIYSDDPLTDICKCGNTIISGSPVGNLKIYDLESNKEIKCFKNFPCSRNNCLLNLDNKKFIYSGSGKIYIIQVSLKCIIKTIDAHSESISAINLLKDGSIISIGNDFEIKRWNIYNGNLIDSGKVNSPNVTSIVHSERENYIAVSTECGEIEILN